MKSTPVVKHNPYYQLHRDYAITVTPADQYQFFGKPQRYVLFRSFINKYFSKFEFNFNLTIEISEPRGMKLKGFAGPRLHLHGVFSFNKTSELNDFLLYGYRKICKIGNLDIDTIKDPSLWYTYCHKNKNFKNPTLSNNCLIPPPVGETKGF